MNLSNNIANKASLDSRRVAGGTYCEILGGTPWAKDLLYLLQTYGHMPIYSIIDHRTGYDETTGMAFVYPKHSSDIVNDQLFGVLKSLNKEQQELIKAADPNDKEAVNKALGLISDKQKKVIDYLRNLLILVTIRRDSDWGIPNALLHDVFIETQEVMPPEAYIVPRNTLEVDYNAKRPIKPRENK